MTLAVLWTRAALLTRRRVGLPQGGPEAERTIGDGDRRWNGEPTVLEVEEQFEPALFALSDAVDDGDQFLLAVGRGPHDHEQALLRIGRVFQANSHVDPVRPDGDVLLSGEVAAAPLIVFPTPSLLEPNDHVWTEALRRRPDEGFERLPEVAGRDTLEVEPGNEILHRSALPQVRGKDLRREDDPLVDDRCLVADSWLAHLEDARAGRDLPGRQVAVTDDATAATLVEQHRMLLEEGIHLALQSCLQHPPRSITDDRVERAPPALHDLVDRLRAFAGSPHDVCFRSWTFRTANRKTSHGGVSFCPNVGRLVG